MEGSLGSGGDNVCVELGGRKGLAVVDGYRMCPERVGKGGGERGGGRRKEGEEGKMRKSKKALPLSSWCGVM